MITTSAPARSHAWSARAWASEKAPSASRKSDPPRPSRVPSRSVYTQRSGIAGGYGSRMSAEIWRLRGSELRFPPPRATGIVNVTEDSFFSGARSGTPDRAVADGLALVAAGFDLLDVGAVAARSGPPVSSADERARLIPAVRDLASQGRVPVIADTFSVETATEALAAGAAAINDISGCADDRMAALVAGSGCGYVLMPIEGPPRVDRDPPAYADVVTHIRGWFEERIDAMVAAGVEVEQIAIDP